MSVSINEVKHIADLAKLDFSEDEYSELTKDMNSILKYMNKLNELNTDGIEPLLHPGEMFNENREDIAVKGISKKDAFLNSKNNDDDFFIIPKIIG